MFVSPRFRDIFATDPIRGRRSQHARRADDRQDARLIEPLTGRADADAVWRDITAAHRRAARAFTPECTRASDLVQDES